jgi:hypothetical protein
VLSLRALTTLATLAALALAAACSSPTAPADDPAAALRSGFESLAALDAVAVTATIDGTPDPADLPGWTDTPLASLLTDAALEIRSSTTEAAHARLLVPEPAAVPEAAAVLEAGMAARGLGDLGARLLDGAWVRVAVLPARGGDAEPADRIARGLAAAGTDLVDAADEVRHLGTDGEHDRLQVVAAHAEVRRFLDAVVAAVGAIDDSVPREAERAEEAEKNAGTGATPVEVDAWLAAGRLVALEVDLRDVHGGAGAPVRARLEVAELDGGLEVDTDAPAFALRGLLDEVGASPQAALLAQAGTTGPSDDGAGGSAPGAGDGTDGTAGDDGPRDTDGADATDPDTRTDPEPPPRSGETGDAGDGASPAGSDDDDPGDGRDGSAGPTEPPPLREGGVLEEAFEDENPFEDDPVFDCIADEELAALGETLGPDAVAEVEELIELGYLERC